jgi:hypothetical protein
MKTLTLFSLSTPDNPEFGYGDYITVAEDKDIMWGSHASCCPNPYKLNGQGIPIPWKLAYDWIDYQEADWECVQHYKYGKCLLINNGGEVKSRNPIKNSDGSIFTEVFVHSGGMCNNPNWRCSAGCLTIPPDIWKDFMAQFKVGEKGILIVRPLIEDKRK